MNKVWETTEQQRYFNGKPSNELHGEEDSIHTTLKPLLTNPSLSATTGQQLW